MFTARHDFNPTPYNMRGTRFDMHSPLKHTPTMPESVDKGEQMFSENPRGSYLSSLENRNQLNQVLSKPKMNSLQGRGRFDEDVPNTPGGSPSLRSIFSLPVSTLPQRDPLEEDEFHNFGRNRSDTGRQCQSLGCIQQNQTDLGSMRRAQSYFVKHPEGKSCNGNLNIENEQLIERSKDGEDIPISCSSINKSSDNTQPCYTTATAAIKPKKHFFSVFGVNKCQKSSKPPQGSEHDTDNSSSNREAKGMFSITRTKFGTCDMCNQPYTHGLSSTLLSLTK